jgi:hypothetical protein
MRREFLALISKYIGLQSISSVRPPSKKDSTGFVYCGKVLRRKKTGFLQTLLSRGGNALSCCEAT